MQRRPTTLASRFGRTVGVVAAVGMMLAPSALAIPRPDDGYAGATATATAAAPGIGDASDGFSGIGTTSALAMRSDAADGYGGIGTASALAMRSDAADG